MALVGVGQIPAEVCSFPEVLTREVPHRPWAVVLQGDREGLGRLGLLCQALVERWGQGAGGAAADRGPGRMCGWGGGPSAGLGEAGTESPGHILLSHLGSFNSTSAPHLGPGKQNTGQGPKAPNMDPCWFE